MPLKQSGMRISNDILQEPRAAKSQLPNCNSFLRWAGDCNDGGKRRDRAKVVFVTIVIGILTLRQLRESTLETRTENLIGQTSKQTQPRHQRQRGNDLFVKYDIIPMGSKSVPWTCNGKDDPSRALLPEEMRPYFNFTTTMQTNLKILVMGDSIGIQVSQYLQDVARQSSNTPLSAQKVLKRASGMGREAHAIHVTAPLVPTKTNISQPGGGRGAIGGWRIVGMFLEDALGWAQANWNRGWLLGDVEALRDYVGQATTTSTPSPEQNNTKVEYKEVSLRRHKPVKGEAFRKLNISASSSGDFDVFVFRIPSPSWVPLSGVTEATLAETIKLAHKLFGVRVVVFVSMHYCNNVLTPQDYEEMKRRNAMVAAFARNWTETHHHSKAGKEGVHTVYVLDQGRLHDSLMEWNSRRMGFDTTNSSFLEVKLEGFRDNRGVVQEHFRLSVGHVCAEKVPHNAAKCLRNAITVDGMHPCMTTLGPRVVAGLACQLQCAFDNDNHEKEGDLYSASSSLLCAQACNDRYMNVTSRI